LVVGALLLAATESVVAAPDLHVIVRARPGVTPTVAPGTGGPTLRATQARQAASAPDSRGLAATLQAWDASAIRPVFEGFGNPQLARQLGLDRYFRIDTPAGTDTPAMAADLGQFGSLVESVQLDAFGEIATLPTDPDFELQWGLLNNGTAGLAGVDINITPGWNLTTGNPDYVLAVLDAGMDPHTELAGRLIPGRNVAANPDNDDTSDVCISHGTHVAGIAAANANNGQGIAGVDWQCRIMPVRVLNSCSGLESIVAEGIIWATDNGADVINMSLQYSTGTDVFRNAVLYAHQQGVVMVAAAGNYDANPLRYPAQWPETIAVGSMNSDGIRSSNSSMGPNLDVMAPGVVIWSLRDTTLYQNLTGTSMAAPHVTGIVLLMKTIAPDLTLPGIRQILHDTAVDMQTPGFDEATGYGRVDAYAALIESHKTTVDLDDDGTIGIGDMLILLGIWGQCPDPELSCEGDFDDDGDVGITDFLILLGYWV
jgi:subtilisin family serine protease